MLQLDVEVRPQRVRHGMGSIGGVGASVGCGACVGGASVGCGACVGCGGVGAGPGEGEDDPSILKSKQEMKVSGGLPGAQVPLVHGTSDSLKVSVFLPMLLTSLHVFPVFQRNRPIPTPPGHEKEEGTW